MLSKHVLMHHSDRISPPVMGDDGPQMLGAEDDGDVDDYEDEEQDDDQLLIDEGSVSQNNGH